jgi:hypothetical protein
MSLFLHVPCKQNKSYACQNKTSQSALQDVKHMLMLILKLCKYMCDFFSKANLFVATVTVVNIQIIIVSVVAILYYQTENMQIHGIQNSPTWVSFYRL